MPMNTPQALFMNSLCVIYDAEHRILQILQTLASESTDPQATQAYQTHEQQTRQQIQNLEQCFRILGQPPDRVPDLTVEGLKNAHEAFLKDNPTKNILTMFDLEAAFQTEHYEIASYLSLIEAARAMNASQVVQLLQQNLQQEEWMAQTVSGISRQLDQQHIQPIGQMGPGFQPQVTP